MIPKVKKAKAGGNVVSTGKMPDVHTPTPGRSGFTGPGLNVPKTPKDYSKKGK